MIDIGSHVHMLHWYTFATHICMLLQRFICRKIDQIKYDARHFDAAFKTYLRKKKMKVGNLLHYMSLTFVYRKQNRSKRIFNCSTIM